MAERGPPSEMLSPIGKVGVLQEGPEGRMETQRIQTASIPLCPEAGKIRPQSRKHSLTQSPTGPSFGRKVPQIRKAQESQGRIHKLTAPARGCEVEVSVPFDWGSWWRPQVSLGSEIYCREDRPAPLEVLKKIIISFHSEILLLGIYPKKERAVSTKVTRGLFIK